MSRRAPSDPPPGQPWVVTLDVAAKVALVVLVALVAVDPEWGNLEGKAPTARALIYPLAGVIVPTLYWGGIVGRDGRYPWLADLLATSIGFSDVLGNRLDLFDSVVWFDDWMHVMNTGLASATVLLLTSVPGRSAIVLLERSVAVGMTVSIWWEVWEYYAFLADSSEPVGLYADTLGDLALGWLGAVIAAVGVYAGQRAHHPGADRALLAQVSRSPRPTRVP